MDSNIITFRLSSPVSSSCLLDCVELVMEQGIEELELDVHLDCVVDLPPSLFSCNTLRVLTLNHQNPYPNLRASCPVMSAVKVLYTRASLPSVHALCLTHIWLNASSDVFSGSNFPLLRKLCLKDSVGMSALNINSPGLEILKLEGSLNTLDISCIGLLELQVTGCSPYMNSVAKNFAPSLRRFCWDKSVIFRVKCMTESFEYLDTGKFYLLRYWKPQSPVELQMAATFISALCFVQSLSVRRRVLEILSSIDSESGLPCSFNNLVTLELHIELTKNQIRGIICFLRSSPILHTITIGVNCSKNAEESCNDERY